VMIRTNDLSGLKKMEDLYGISPARYNHFKKLFRLHAENFIAWHLMTKGSCMLGETSSLINVVMIYNKRS
jgi:hypothetical protein